MKAKLLLLTLLTALCLPTQATIEPTSTQMWWGYFTDTDAANIDLANDGLGVNYAATLSAAISVPSTDAFVSGSTIKAVRFWLSGVSSLTDDDLIVWISKTMPSDISQADYTQSVSKASLADGANDVALTTPFAVNGATIYVGYTLKTSTRAYPIVKRGNGIENAFYIRVNNNTWDDISTADYGKLALQLLLDGGDYPKTAATPLAINPEIAVSGTSVTIPVTIRNTGLNSLTSISYTITSDGSVSGEQTKTFSDIPLYDSQSFNVTLSAGTDAKKYVRTITITKVNGVSNQSGQTSVDAELIAVNEKPAVVPVVEEFTGTWCGYCPYGMVGMQKAHEKYGDQVVLIAAHSGDVMDIGAYSPVISAYASGYPSSRINRQGSSIYPYYIDNSYYMNPALNRVTQGTIGLTATWTDNSKTAVNFQTTSKFFYDGQDERYGIAFVLVEDGLTGTGSSWAQSNYLSGGSGDDDMSFWYNASSYVSGLEYDHVAVAAWDVMGGINGSVSSTIRNGEEQQFSYTGDLSGFSLIQDKSRLTAVALLIDRRTGYIVNAAQVPIQSGKKGDVNGDGDVDIADAVCIVNYVVSKPNTSFNKAAADANGDGDIDIADAVHIVNIVVGKIND
jgi:hypothetical protein